ncbi:hypothetical protein [Streptomyces parvus]|uniref:hypothetical protein n=1 Tax=Streptomyces parvus TaxID=66428 RepID=UPI0034068CF4
MAANAEGLTAMHLLTIDPCHTVTYRPVEYRIPLGLAPYRPSISGAAELAATLVARLRLLGHRVEGPRYIEEEPRCDRGEVWDSLGSRAMRVECHVGGRAVAWRYDRFAPTLETAWVVEVDGQAQPAGLSPYLRAHERITALTWIAHRAIQGR